MSLRETEMSDFDQVSTMNVAFGNPQGDPKSPDWERLKSQYVNILDEYNEGLEALQNKDLTALRDALSDILVFAHGVAHIAGTNMDEDMDAVYDSNLSKFCADEAELEATKMKYDSLGVEYYVDGNFPFTFLKSSKNQTGKDNKNYPKDKFLKGIGFKEPIFKPV